MESLLLRSAVAAVLVLTALGSAPSYNVTEYVSSALGDVDLRERALAALHAEMHAKDPNYRREDGRCETGVRAPPCPANRYRTADGTCNNVRHPRWGARGQPFLRLLPPGYADGVSSPRTAPQVQDVWAKLAPAWSSPNSHGFVTSLVGAWGELLLRDMALPASPESFQCCQTEHPECSALRDDAGCVSYQRSLPSTTDSCTFDKRQQMNMVSSFLDGSALYGDSEAELISRRTGDAGQVNIDMCAICKEQSGLGALYTVLLREHNRLALVLAELNPAWDDNTLFHEARKLLVAQIQHVTYWEFLPTVMGEVAVHKLGLEPKVQGFFSGYSSSNNAGMFNSIATTVMRLFSIMIPPSLRVGGESRSRAHVELIDALLREPAMDLSLGALRPGGGRVGPVLIQAGRDHGLPGYILWFKHCAALLGYDTSNQTAWSLQQELLQRAYSRPEEVDLVVGASLEGPVPGAVLGPTFSCLLGQQFAVARSGDRFWLENDIPPSSFTPAQLQEIRKVTLAGLLCLNTPRLTTVQSRAFVQEDPFLNVRISCDLQPALELQAWEDKMAASISNEMVMDAVEKAGEALKRRRQQEFELWSVRGGLDPKSPAGSAASFSKATNEALALANTSTLLEFASEELMNSIFTKEPTRFRRQAFKTTRAVAFGGDNVDDLFGNTLQGLDVSAFVPPAPDLPHCDSNEERVPCNPTYPFRTISGNCNNLRRPRMGRALTTFNRLLPPAYEDGVSRPRLTSIAGGPLPSPRRVSTMIHVDISDLHSRYSMMLMQFAQFTDHDLTFTPVHKGFFSSIPDCRSCNSPRTVHPECMPIPVPEGDHFYPPMNQTTGERMCFPFMRSLPGQLTLGAREQINQNSAFLDLSQVYGEHACMARTLRASGGMLNVTRIPGRGKDLLPQSPVHPECRAPSGYCFIAGDGRASEQPALTVMHTLYMREHNRLVEGLRLVNPHWDDERLYQHARRIHIAMQQHVTYNEFLPRLLGWAAVNLYELKLRPQGYYKGYNPQCNPSIVNEFAAAGFRIGHSLLRPHIPRLSPSYQPVDPPILLRTGFFNPDIVLFQPDIMDEVARGLVSTPVENMDQFITGEVTNHLFEDKKIPHSGIDLIALNIQRGRDHGVRSYNDYRALCNLKRAETFDDLSREMAPETIARFKRIYASVDDIDLFPGGMSERSVQGGLVGPTFACIIGTQFRQLRKCDRFWYESDDPVVRFTEAQLAEIRKATLAKILCENMDNPAMMQRAALDQPSEFLNPRVPCHSLPTVNLGAWKETSQGCQIGGASVAVGATMFPSPCTSCVCSAEGPQCASLRITDCGQLLQQQRREAVLKDDVCVAQCGFLLQTTQPTTQPPLQHRPRSLPATQLVPPPPKAVAPRRPQRPATFPSFSSFFLSDT